MKELWELSGLIFKPYNEAKEILEKEGFEVVKPFDIKRIFLENIDNIEKAKRFQMFSPIQDDDSELMAIYNKFERMVLKDNRGGNTSRSSSSWETVNGYLDYRSGCFYDWY